MRWPTPCCWAGSAVARCGSCWCRTGRSSMRGRPACWAATWSTNWTSISTSPSPPSPSIRPSPARAGGRPGRERHDHHRWRTARHLAAPLRRPRIGRDHAAFTDGRPHRARRQPASGQRSRHGSGSGRTPPAPPLSGLSPAPPVRRSGPVETPPGDRVSGTGPGISHPWAGSGGAAGRGARAVPALPRDRNDPNRS